MLALMIYDNDGGGGGGTSALNYYRMSGAQTALSIDELRLLISVEQQINWKSQKVWPPNHRSQRGTPGANQFLRNTRHKQSESDSGQQTHNFSPNIGRRHPGAPSAKGGEADVVSGSPLRQSFHPNLVRFHEMEIFQRSAKHAMERHLVPSRRASVAMGTSARSKLRMCIPNGTVQCASSSTTTVCTQLR